MAERNCRKGNMRGTKTGECVCKTHFKLPEEGVQFHIITWEGQQRCSFLTATFYASIYTDQQRLIILFPHTLFQTHRQKYRYFLLCFPVFFLTLNLTKKMEKRQKISYKLWKLAQLYLTGWVKHAVSEQAPLLRENLLNPPPCSVISAFNRQCWTSRWSALTVWRQSL